MVLNLQRSRKRKLGQEVAGFYFLGDGPAPIRNGRRGLSFGVGMLTTYSEPCSSVKATGFPVIAQTAIASALGYSETRTLMLLRHGRAKPGGGSLATASRDSSCSRYRNRVSQALS